MNISPDLLVVPPDLQWEAQELLKSSYYPEEGETTTKLATNVLKGVVDLLVTPYLTCLLYTSPSPRDAHESRMPSSA